MSRLGAVPLQMKGDSCGPCLSDKQLKKLNEQTVTELKATINYLVKHGGYDEKAMFVIGSLVTRLIQLQGPIK